MRLRTRSGGVGRFKCASRSGMQEVSKQSGLLLQDRDGGTWWYEMSKEKDTRERWCGTEASRAG